MFTIFGIAKTKKNLVKMGTTKTDAEWFFLTSDVIKKVGSGNLVGKEIETYESSWDKTLRGQLINKITIPNAEAKKGETLPKNTSTEKINRELNEGEKNTDSKSIEIAKVTAQTMVSLQGFVEPNNVASVIKIVYNTYKELI